MSRVTVNGAEFYFEVRGMGPPVLLIMGATGDGGHFDTFADLLADEFTVVSYDRRGNGRSPVPAGWQTTSPEEQADDAAALLEALETGPAAVFGTSSGGTFALCLLVRHPAWVRGAILHEPGLYALVDFGLRCEPRCGRLSRRRWRRGGPPAAVERFWCYVAGDDGWNKADARASRAAARHRQHVVRGRAGELRAVPARRGNVGRALSTSEPARERGRPPILPRDHGPARQALGRGGRHHAGHARGISRSPRTSLRRLSAHSCGRSLRPVSRRGSRPGVGGGRASATSGSVAELSAASLGSRLTSATPSPVKGRSSAGPS